MSPFDMVVGKPRGVSVHLNPIALRKAKIARNFGLSEGNRVKYEASCIRFHVVVSKDY